MQDVSLFKYPVTHQFSKLVRCFDFISLTK